MDKKLHIVSFDVPWPANYGGVIDVFYKIKALHAAGVKIVLHCFLYGKGEQAPELDIYCEKVHYYRRTTGIQGFSLLRPYIVNSRKNAALLKNLLADESPILFEGLHSCYYLNHPSLQNRNKYVRAHNIEHEYYRALEASEKKWWKRLFFKTEAGFLERYEIILKEAKNIFAIAAQDATYFENKYVTKLIPAFHANSSVSSNLGRGEYCLYQGNLAVPENEQAVLYLIEHVFSKIGFPVVIAGASPSDLLRTSIADIENVELVASPSNEEMSNLVADAHIHVLFAQERSGLKLKVLNSLFQGRHLIANDNLLETEKLKSVAIEANAPADFIKEINRLQDLDFTAADVQKRKRLLLEEYSNEVNAQKIIETIFA